MKWWRSKTNPVGIGLILLLILKNIKSENIKTLDGSLSMASIDLATDKHGGGNTTAYNAKMDEMAENELLASIRKLLLPNNDNSTGINKTLLLEAIMKILEQNRNKKLDTSISSLKILIKEVLQNTTVANEPTEDHASLGNGIAGISFTFVFLGWYTVILFGCMLCCIDKDAIKKYKCCHFPEETSGYGTIV